MVEPEWDGKDLKAGFQSTVTLMNEGYPWIYQGVFMNDSAAGFPDLLKKTPGSSTLGDYTYVPIDVKGHKQVTKKDRYQLLGYACLLESMLGYRPTEGGIWLNTGEIAEVDLEGDAEQFEKLLSNMDRIRDGTLITGGYRCGECGTCEWIDHCFSIWEENESVCLFYGVTENLARRFTGAGFASWRDVARSNPSEISTQVKIKPKLAQAFWLQVRARARGCWQIVTPASFPSDVPIHFYDIETFGDCIYLHGDIRVFKSKREEKQFYARDPSEEKQAWLEHLDYLARDDKAIIYFWADYERGFAKALREKHGGNAAGCRHFKENLVDQCKFVRDHFVLPVFSYGIKHVAPVFGFKWSADGAGGLNSEAWYKEWLEAGDEAVFQKILRYNLDDVLAMEVIDRELQKVAANEADYFV